MSDSVVVIKPHQDVEIRSKTPQTSLGPEDIFKAHVLQGPDEPPNMKLYTILERSTITTEPRDRTLTHYDIKSQSGLIRKIHLVDFPPGQYFLQIHFMNAATAKLENGQYTFHIDAENRSNTLENYVKMACFPNDRDSVPDRDKYINIGRIDHIRILSPQPFEKEMKLRFEGLFLDKNDNWVYSDKVEYTIYPNETDLICRKRMVRRMIITSKKDENIYIRIAGRIYGPIPVHSNGQIIDFEGFDIIQSIETKYMPDPKKCIPFNRIREVGIIASDELDIVILSYGTYMSDAWLTRFSN